MPERESIRRLLEAAWGRSKRGVWQAVELADGRPRVLVQLVECLWDAETDIAAGAAEALERLTRERPQRIARWKDELIGRLAEAEEKRLRWNLALTVVRIRLTPPECRRVAGVLKSWLDDKSSIVKTAALHGLADLTRHDPALIPEAIDLLRIAGRSGTPAMRARSRILLQALEAPAGKHAQRASLHMFD